MMDNVGDNIRDYVSSISDRYIRKIPNFNPPYFKIPEITEPDSLEEFNTYILPQRFNIISSIIAKDQALLRVKEASNLKKKGPGNHRKRRPKKS